MSKPQDIEIVKTDLEIEEELEAHKKGWTAQRIGLALMYLLVLSAAAGLFGDGIASKKTETEHAITVESERFYRYDAPMQVKISAAGSDNNITVAFSNDYLKHFELRSIVPEPAENQITNNQIRYSFDATGDADITFYFVPKSRGSISGSLHVNDQQFELKHYIYP